MKKKLKLIIASCAVLVSVFFGGVVFAASWGSLQLPFNGELNYYGTDEANIILYKNNISFEGYSSENKTWIHVVKPEDLVKSINDLDGNAVDFSELEVSYKEVIYNPSTKTTYFNPLSVTEALKSDGTFNIEEHPVMSVTFIYNYEMPKLNETSTIKKTVTIENEFL